MKITVLKRHVKKGLSGNALSCPIALAIREKQKKGGICVGLFDASINGRIYEFKDLEKVEIFIRKFDKMQKVKTPFHLELIPAK